MYETILLARQLPFLKFIANKMAYPKQIGLGFVKSSFAIADTKNLEKMPLLC